MLATTAGGPRTRSSSPSQYLGYSKPCPCQLLAWQPHPIFYGRGLHLIRVQSSGFHTRARTLKLPRSWRKRPASGACTPKSDGEQPEPFSYLP